MKLNSIFRSKKAVKPISLRVIHLATTSSSFA